MGVGGLRQPTAAVHQFPSSVHGLLDPRSTPSRIRLQLDHETQINLLPWLNSGATIGAAYEIINNRTRLAPYQTVQLDGHLDVFRLISDSAVILAKQGNRGQFISHASA